MKKKNKKPKINTVAYYITIIIGLVLLLASVIIKTGPLSESEDIENEAMEWLLVILSEILSTIGLALAISGITTRIHKAETIESILSSTEKENMIIALLERNTHLDNYLELKTNELYNIENRYFTNYKVNVIVSKKDDRIIAKSEVSYLDNGRTKVDKKLNAFFDKEEDVMDKFVIINPKNRNQYVEFKNDPNSGDNQIKSQLSGEYGVYENEYFVEVPQEFLGLDQLEIKKSYTTYGSDHWIEVGTVFARPTHNVTITVTVENDLVIKDSFVTGDSKLYDISETETYYSFSNPEWISSYCGICLLVAKKDNQ